jgi:hypothetical protein
VEAYGAFALGAWLNPDVPEAARRFARWSAIGALALGMAGQVIYHLLAAGHAHRAPWVVVMLVACLPVVTLGFGAALTHLLHPSRPLSAPLDAPEGVPTVASVEAPEAAPAGVPERVPEAVSKARQRRAKALPNSASRRRGVHAPKVVFAAELAAGELPSIRTIKRQCKVGQDRAREIRDELAGLIESGPVRVPGPVLEPVQVSGPAETMA